MALRLEHPTEGNVLFRGHDIANMTRDMMKEYRASVQAVFQDPWSSLNPRMRAGAFIAEPLIINTTLRGRALRERVQELLIAVGLEAAAMDNFPHQFSGGMRQRVAIARALALQPALIVLDEPVSSLDVSVRAEIMNLLKDLQDRHGMAYLLIAHDLATVRYLAHAVIVMYLGQIVEKAPAESLFSRPYHPYTHALMSAALPARPGQHEEGLVLHGELPSATNPPKGCRFHTRCWLRQKKGNPSRCVDEAPPLRQVGEDHLASCHYAEELMWEVPSP